LARLAVQLGMWLSRPARAGAGWARHGLLDLAPSRAGSSPPWARPSPLYSSRAGGLLSFFADKAVPRVGLRGSQCGGARIRCADGRARVRVSAEARMRVWAPDGHSGKCLNGMAATRTRRRGRVAGVDAHGEAMARAW
jgi:hypothetical protein